MAVVICLVEVFFFTYFECFKVLWGQGAGGFFVSFFGCLVWFASVFLQSPIAQNTPELTILLPCPPKGSHYRHEPAHQLP